MSDKKSKTLELLKECRFNGKTIDETLSQTFAEFHKRNPNFDFDKLIEKLKKEQAGGKE